MALPMPAALRRLGWYRRRLISREMLEKLFIAALPCSPESHEFRNLFEPVFALAI